MSDPLVDALRRLVEREGGAVAVADAAGVNDQTIYQVLKGIKLPSGNPKGVGPKLRAGLDKAFPGWRAAPLVSALQAVPSAPQDGAQTMRAADAAPPALTLADALEMLGIALAVDMPADVRDDLADALAKLARRGGAARDQAQVLQLLQAGAAGGAEPVKRQRAA